MRDFDRLPPDLHRWVSTASLPWRVRSVARAFEKALSRTGDRQLALRELDRIEARLIARDAQSLWGQTHPSACDVPRSQAPDPDPETMQNPHIR